MKYFLVAAVFLIVLDLFLSGAMAVKTTIAHNPPMIISNQ